MDVINDLVGYHNLKIVQNPEWFKFSMDSILLPNFITINKNVKKILDLGTGNAPIPIILTTRTDAQIYGIEIQKEIYELAQKSIDLNNLGEKITLINDNMKNLKNYFTTDTFDIIVSNPPYFKVEEHSRINENSTKSIARHELEITLEEIIHIAGTYLKNDGVFAMVHRTERLIEIIDLMKKNRLEPKKIQLIYPKVKTDSNMMLIEARKNGKPGLKVLEPLIAHEENGDYSKKMKEIFHFD